MSTSWAKRGRPRNTNARPPLSASRIDRASNAFDLIFPSLRTAKEVDPLPFLIGMKDVVADKRFTFELVAGIDLEHFIVRATPVKTDPKPLFDAVVITLDKERCLPVVIEYQRGWRGRDARHFTVVDARLDQPIDDAALEPQKPEGWRVEMVH